MLPARFKGGLQQAQGDGLADCTVRSGALTRPGVPLLRAGPAALGCAICLRLGGDLWRCGIRNGGQVGQGARHRGLVHIQEVWLHDFKIADAQPPASRAPSLCGGHTCTELCFLLHSHYRCMHIRCAWSSWKGKHVSCSKAIVLLAGCYPMEACAVMYGQVIRYTEESSRQSVELSPV